MSKVNSVVNKILEGTSVREALSDTEIVNALGNTAYRESGKDMYFVLAGDPVGIDSVFVYDAEGKLSNHEFRPNEKIYCGPGDIIEIYANTKLSWCYIPRSGGKDKELGFCNGIQFKVPVKVAGLAGMLPIWLQDQGEDTEYYMLCLDTAKSWCKQITHIKPLKGY